MKETASLASISALLEAFLERAARDPEQVALLQQLALSILETYPVEPKEEKLAQAEALTPQVTDTEIDALIESWSSRPERDDPEPNPTPDAPLVPLSALPDRLMLKAEACFWLAQYGYTYDLVALAQRRELVARAKSAACYLWMLDPDLVNPENSRAFSDVAGAYRATARSLTLHLSGHTSPATLKLMAQLQAALRERVSAVRPGNSGWSFLDEDQKCLHAYLREQAEQQQVFLYGLALKDTITADEFGVALTTLEQHESTQCAATRQTDEVDKHLKRADYHAQQLQKRSRRPEYEWKKIAEAVAAATDAGMPESDLRLRELLEPLALNLPADAPYPQLVRILGEAAKVAREQRERLAARAQRMTETQPPEVQQVARLLSGRSAVVIGGRPNSKAALKLEDAFGCAVNWLASKPHDPPKLFETHITKPEVVLVLLLIRWSSHVFGEVDAFCREHGKYLVRIQAGYNPKRVAQEILEQAGERLGKGA